MRDDLERVAAACLPPDGRHTLCRIAPYNPDLVYDKARRFRPDVELVMTLLHRDLAIHQPIDNCESQCLGELIADLRALGVQEGSWDEHHHQQWLAEQEERPR